MRTLARTLLAGLAAGVLLAGCGGDDDDEPPTPDNAVNAQTENVVDLAGVEYGVTLFRQINPAVPPGEALWEGEPPGDGVGLYAAIVRACGTGGDATEMSDEIILEDAFGEVFEPQPGQTADELEYTAVPLEGEECAPREGSAADQTFGGGALVFEVPFESVGQRPLVLQITAPDGSQERRIQLDV